MLELADNFSKNFPAFQYAYENLNNHALVIQQNLAQVVAAERDEEISEARRNLLFLTTDLRQSWINVLNGVRAYMAFRGKTDRENLQLFLDVFKDKLARVNEHAEMLNFEQSDSLEQVNEHTAAYLKALTGMIEIHSSDRWRTDAYLIRNEVGPLTATIKANIRKLVDLQRTHNAELSDALITDVAGTWYFVAVLVVVGLVIGIGSAWLISTLVVSPLRNAVAAMEDIAQGEGDLTHRLDVKGKDEIAQLARAFNLFADKIRDTIAQVTGATSQLAAAAEEMSHISTETSNGVQRQRSETEQVATAMNEMTATVQEVARNAESAAEAARGADEESSKGQHVVTESVSSIDTLAGEVERAAGVIQRLEKDTESIGTVLEVIQGIAEQTNLLALNAAIEAARAGEQGRGFAVVADEVRSLASRTQSSTQEIKEMIERLQANAQDAVNVMEGGREKARSSVDFASKAGEALERITGAVNAIATMNNQIAEAARQQGEVSEEINRNVVNISQVAEETSGSTSQLANASQELARLAADLQGLVGRFKV
ncbi:MAG TPA: methyl-accepting chemotaxis protein [Gammaproteobacteria bacterium]|nr:methyl-accepting chemotaxis protein [Gammaproteobacteria bacterium]